MPHSIFFVSDGTGITAETLGRALLTQFDAHRFRQHVLRFVTTEEEARRAAEQINAVADEDGTAPVVFSTLVDPHVRAVIEGSHAKCFDLFATFVGPLEAALGEASAYGTIGYSHRLSDRQDYDIRMDAVNFALGTDDGAKPSEYARADAILVGVSRSGKTPTSLYLALGFGVYVANYPFTEEALETLALPRDIQPYRPRLFGLTIRPERLQQIRETRRPNSRYASARQCRREVEQAEALFRHHAIPFVDTTIMSVEEIAASLLHHLSLRRRLY